MPVVDRRGSPRMFYRNLGRNEDFGITKEKQSSNPNLTPQVRFEVRNRLLHGPTFANPTKMMDGEDKWNLSPDLDDPMWDLNENGRGAGMPYAFCHTYYTYVPPAEFYAAHPEHRIKPGSQRGSDLVHNFAVPEVRAQKLALIRELCENYDLDGLELDFLRFYSYFPEETPLEQRRAIMTGLVKEVRQMLGPKRWLCARVPCYLTALDVLGLDLKALVAAGLDMVNASAHYFTTQQHDLAVIRKQTEGAALYFELCHTIWKGDKVQAGYDVFPFRRATREHLHTSAHLAYARGADGISLFNFAYYRQHGQGEGRGIFGEPPFEALKALREPQTLAKAPQHWFIAYGWRSPGAKPLPVPRKIELGKPAKFNFDLAPPAGGWKHDARVRIQADKSLGGDEWTATFNGEAIAASADVSEPFIVPYPSMIAKPEELRAWTIPTKLLRNEANR
jgi:hypothetical protein